MNVLQMSAVPIRLRTNIALCRFPPAPLSTVHLLLLIFPLQHGVSQTSPGWHRNVNVSSSETSCLPVTCLVNLTACVMTSVCLGLLKPLRRSVTNSETAEEEQRPYHPSQNIYWLQSKCMQILFSGVWKERRMCWRMCYIPQYSPRCSTFNIQ